MDTDDKGDYMDLQADSFEGIVQVHVIEESEEVPMTSENQLAADMPSLHSNDDDDDDDGNDALITDCEVNYDLKSLEEYRTVRNLYRDLPRDMFVVQVLKDYNSSEPDLERLRTTFFEPIKSVIVNFPYGADAELKR